VIRLINWTLSRFAERAPFAPLLFKGFARVLPIGSFNVRGVMVKVVLPLHQVGVHAHARAWNEREPETLDWIDAFEPEAVFFDVGASFGNETLYAALKPNGPRQIVAFDVEFLGSYDLAFNLLLNGIDKVMNCFVAVGSQNQLMRIPENTNYFCVPGRPTYDQSSKWVPVISIDEFCRRTGIFPNYVKIDVDGTELEVVHGMSALLLQPALRSVLVEVNSPTEKHEITGLMRLAGFEERSHGHPNTFNVIFGRS
jgi:FkbM family methyltransferase